MHDRKIIRYGKGIKLIYSGEYYVTDNPDYMIGTLLGSCIAVCLYDKINKIGGMNHFMLPGRVTEVDKNELRSAKYGVSAINDLLLSMYSFHAEKKNITAKLFGGGSVLLLDGEKNTIPENNIRLARLLMEMEDIPIIEEDVGGIYIRKVIFAIDTGNAYLKKTERRSLSDYDADEA